MKARRGNGGRVIVTHDIYRPLPDVPERLIEESTVIGHYADALEHPGSSYLWIGGHHHLSREEVRELIDRLQHWLDNKRLEDVDGGVS